MITDETERLLQAGSAGTLKDAEAFVRHSVCADGSVDGEDGDFTGPERQWAPLIQWADSCGKNLPLNFTSPEREGGREHDSASAYRRHCHSHARLTVNVRPVLHPSAFLIHPLVSSFP